MGSKDRRKKHEFTTIGLVTSVIWNQVVGETMGLIYYRELPAIYLSKEVGFEA